MGVGPLVGEELRHPHLVLADVGDDGAAAAGRVADGARECPRATSPPRKPSHRGRTNPAISARHASHVARRDAREQRRRIGLGVADDADRHGNVLADLRGVELDVDDLGAPRERREVAGDAIVEAEPHADDEVGLLDGAVDVHLAVHAGHAEVERMRLGKRADPEQRRDDGNAGSLGQRAQLIVGVAENDAVPGHDERPLGARR